MSIIVDVLTGGSNNHETTSEAANAFATDFVPEGIVGTLTNTSGVAPATGGFAVNAQGTPAMAVDVSAGVAYVTATPTSQGSQVLRVKSNATEEVVIAANSSGSTKYDWVYISISAANAANPAVAGDNVATLVTSRSTSASSDDGTPPTYGYPIAVVTVANGASTITNANITDKRTETGAHPGYQTTGTDQLADASVTPAKWTNPYCFRAEASVAQTGIADATFTKLNFANELYDYNNNFASSTYTAPVNGVYNFSACVLMTGSGSHTSAILAVYKNGSASNGYLSRIGAGTINDTAPGGSIDILLAAGDTVEIYGFCNTSGGTWSTVETANRTWFSGHLVHAT